MVEQNAQQTPQGTAVIAPEQGIEWTHAEFHERCRSLVTGLTELGYKQGDKMVSDMPNTVENLVLQVACSHIGVAVSTMKSSTEEEVLKGFEALAEKAGGAPVGAVVSSIDTPLSAVAETCDIDIITAQTELAGPVLFDALLHRTPSDDAPASLSPDSPHAFFGGTKALTVAEVASLGSDAAYNLGIQANDKVCISITLMHSFGIASAVGGCASAGAAIVLPAVGGIRGCGVPSQRAEVTRSVLSSTQASLLFGDFHTLRALPEPGGLDLSALRGGVIKCGSGTDFMDQAEATVGGHTLTLEYAGVSFKMMGKKP